MRDCDKNYAKVRELYIKHASTFRRTATDYCKRMLKSMGGKLDISNTEVSNPPDLGLLYDEVVIKFEYYADMDAIKFTTYSGEELWDEQISVCYLCEITDFLEEYFYTV